MSFICHYSPRDTYQLLKHLKSTVYLLLILSTFFTTSAYATANSITSNDSKSRNKAIKFEHYRQLKDTFKQQKNSSTLSPAKKRLHDATMRIIIETEKANFLAPSSIQANTDLHELEVQAHARGIKVHRKLERFNLLVLNVTEQQLDALYDDDKVLVVSEDRMLEPVLDVSVPHIGGNVLHNAGFRGQGQAVAILDTGVDEAHPFLGNRVVEEACFSSGDQQDFFTLCPNAINSQVGAGAAHDCSNATGVSSCMHGTHVAGIAAGANTTMTGTAPDASVVAVQVFTFNPARGSINAFTSDIIAAFDWLIHEAQTPNIAAVNLSLGTGVFSDTCDEDVPALTSAIQALRENGVATIIASGNRGQANAVSWPACISSAVTVGASLRDRDFIASFSNSSPMVDLIAPGDDIFSSIPGGTFTLLSGTSMATPHVTGAFAALKSMQPTASIDELEQILKQTGKKLHTTFGFDLPLIDMAAAFNQLKIVVGNGCLAIPGDIDTSIGPLAKGIEKNWSVFASQGGLFRLRVSSLATSGSHLIQVTLNGNSVVLAVGAAGTTLADFANVNAGPNTIKILALSDGVILGRAWLEQLANNNTSATGNCSVVVPPSPDPTPSPEPSPRIGVISENVGSIPVGTEKNWQFSTTTAPANIRISVSSTSTLSSRRILVTIDGISVDISLDANATVPIDFANLSIGTHHLTIKALNENVVIGRVMASNF